MRDVLMLRRTFALAAQGPQADPNPRVGAVILDAQAHVAGEGFHGGAGTPHAEAQALAAAGPAARGGTCYVSLEPCNHTGRTPPCAQALIEAGIVRVVVASRDPNPIARGGLETLRRHGVEVVEGLLAQESRALNREWSHALITGRPFVTWKFASTLDGRVAAADGTSRWITGDAARADVHARRARCGAVMVGTGTVLTDDPALTVRGPDGELAQRQPLRVVMGQRCPQIRADARVRSDEAPTLLLPTRDPAAALAELAAREVRHVFCEGGPTLAAALLREGLIDEVVAYLAPALLGAGAGSLGDLGITTIEDTVRLIPTDVTQLGRDIRVIATPRRHTPKESC
ncbi:bifunctional diaminohydroxyphosphoribosylaminopyrimidine deaminase/5-amino-6-(5-phosphoribosylamino)uracil reductase RibD [Gephyromycinifex aptenodytis]|uniref:bifunctional diaminohydroxyphosphoribosylaminopyrimidine deaminase/5-amino-6-(5-phosphoribosylamino)uracil reductase RibD n=1 Tax=Gephyromycinifex aptenodytis TaxID=2716227 RepID=UPI001445DEE9